MVVATDRFGPGAWVHVQLQVHVNITGVVVLSTSLMVGGKRDDMCPRSLRDVHMTS